MKKTGFTLVELIAVIVILGILVGVSVPIYMSVRDSILETQYENTVSRIETAAVSYAQDTNSQDVVDVNVAFLIENGYISPDDETDIYDPRDNTSLNCYMIHVVIENGNYNAVMEDEATTEDDGTCSMYVSVGDYQIYCNGEECSNSWYSDNVELTLYKGTELVTSSDIEWTSQLGTYETGSSITTSALYLMSTTYIATYKEKILDYDENGTEYVSGEKTYKVSQVIKIDKEKPVINNVTYKNSTDSWVQSNTMYIDATDRNGSGIYGYALIDLTGDCSATTTYQSANSFTLTNNTYKVCVMDNVGNITESDEITVDNIDDLGPSISYDYEPKTWTTEVRLTFSASDTQSDVRGYAITTENEQPTVYINANRTSEYTEWDGSEVSLVKTENATYYLWVVDSAGNVNSASVNVGNIDRVIPVGSISATKSSSGVSVSSGSWSSEGLNFTITTDTCGISGCTIYYCMDTTNSCTPSTVATSGTSITSYNTTTGTYYIRYYIKSGAGLSSTVSSYTAKIDTVTPTVSIAATKKSAGTTISSGTWSSEGLNFKLTIGTSGNSGYTIYYCKDTTNTCTPTTVATSGSSITSYNTTTGTYYIRYYVKSGAGLSSSVSSYTAKVDTTAPTASISAASTSSSYNTTSVNVTVSGSDSGSGVAYVCVQTSSSSSNCTWYSGTSKTVKFTASSSYDGGSTTYYAFTKDAAGNISSVVSKTYTVYKQCSNSNNQTKTTGSCSATCDGGTQTITYTDNYTGGTCSTTTTSCNTQSCSPGYWSGISEYAGSGAGMYFSAERNAECQGCTYPGYTASKKAGTNSSSFIFNSVSTSDMTIKLTGKYTYNVSYEGGGFFFNITFYNSSGGLTVSETGYGEYDDDGEWIWTVTSEGSTYKMSFSESSYSTWSVTCPKGTKTIKIWLDATGFNNNDDDGVESAAVQYIITDVKLGSYDIY